MSIKTELQIRRRANYRRRLTAIQKANELPPLSLSQTFDLLDHLDCITGDGVTDPDLRVLHRLTSRGLLSRRAPGGES